MIGLMHEVCVLDFKTTPFPALPRMTAWLVNEIAISILKQPEDEETEEEKSDSESVKIC